MSFLSEMGVKMRKYLLLFAFLLPFLSQAKKTPPVSDRLVTDYAGVLSQTEADQLENKLLEYERSTSTQISIVIEHSLEGDDLFDYCQRLATDWKIGQKGKNNGILIYVAIDDRKARIQTGYGMEATITDAITTRIRTQEMNPRFKEGQYYAGLDAAVSSIMKAAAGEYQNEDARPLHKKKRFSLAKMIIVIIILIVVFSRFGGGRGRRRSSFGGPLFWGGTFSSGGFSSGGGGGGGFGGFGGGSFGGGGSGGSW